MWQTTQLGGIMESRTVRDYIERIDEYRALAMEHDLFMAELEKLDKGVCSRVRFCETAVQYEVTGISLEEAYKLCGTIKEILERLGHSKDVKWERQDFPAYRSIDFITRTSIVIRIVTVPDDCAFEVIGYEQRPTYKITCRGAE
jgi:hypothetical protein